MAYECQYALIPHPEEPRLLLLPEENGWALPCWTTDNGGSWDRIAPVNRGMQERLGIRLTTLRVVYRRDDSEAQRGVQALAMESHDSAWSPPDGGRWIGRAELETLTLAPPEHRLLLEEWFAEAEDGGLPVQRPPWARPGWFAEAAAWMQAQMARRGFRLTEPVAQFKTGTISCLLRARAAGETFYLKASPAMFAVETRLTQFLAERYPAHIPRLLAWDMERRWLLMHDMGGEKLGKTEDLAQQEEALRAYAEMQKEMTAEVARLLAMGCRDRRLEAFQAEAEAALTETDWTRPGHPKGLTEEEAARLRALAPRLAALCDELEAFGLPATLDHGDLHLWNIVTAEGQSVFFDWSDGCVSHPFFSMTPLLEHAPPGTKERLRDAYLEPWTACAPRERLRAAFERSQTLGWLNHALSYRWIVDHVEPGARWEWEDVPPHYLRGFLERIT